MKLKTSFFDIAVLKKALIRFWPTWGLYLIVGLLITQTGFSSRAHSFARQLGESLSLLGVVNLIYGALVAFLLFGDLFKARMCNALHALPVRREAWFVSHSIAGILMSLGPNLILALLLMPRAAQFWFVPLLWVGVVTLQYLFFFGSAVLAIYLTGNTFAASLVYALINFASMLVMWFVQSFYIPLLYSVKINKNLFMSFSPVVNFFESTNLWTLQHMETCPNTACKTEYYSYLPECQYELVCAKDGWWAYLAIVAAVGVAFLAGALLLYRKRKLECAGDFAAVRPIKTVFTLLGSVAAGMLFWVFDSNYILLLLGGIVGFFVCQMLLMRTIKVFGKKNWIKLGALVAAIAISLGLTAVDAFGITRIVPDADDVVSVTIADRHLTDYALNEIEANLKENQKNRGIDPYYQVGFSGYVILTHPGQIQEAIEIHELLIQEGELSENEQRYATAITIHYQLKNGTTLTRYYYGKNDLEAVRRLKTFTNTPAYILGVNSAQELIENLEYAYFDGDDFYKLVEDDVWLEKLAEALWQDAVEGNLQQKQGVTNRYVELNYRYKDGRYGYLLLYVPKDAVNTMFWMEEYYLYLKANDMIDENDILYD